MANGKKTGGRAKGTPNRASAAKAAEIAATGETPLAYLLRIMRDSAKPEAMRIEAAKSAAPYVHPKLATLEVSGPDGGPIETESHVEVGGLNDEQLRALASIPIPAE